MTPKKSDIIYGWPQRLTGAPVAVTYYDPTEDRHHTQNSITDGEGRAVVEVDGCVGNALILRLCTAL